jgi:hypothetical protein
MRRTLTTLLALFLLPAAGGFAQRTVDFPPAVGNPPPAHKAPPRTQTGGEETSLRLDAGVAMRKTQQREPPPPTNLTIIYKVQYGEDLKYVHPDGTVQVFPQWESYKNDASNLVQAANTRLADGNNYQYATAPLASEGFDPLDIPILYMTGDYDFVLRDSEVTNIREFVLKGGTFIFNAARGREEFVRAVIREMRRVFPDRGFVKLPADHPVFNSHSRISDANTLMNGVESVQTLPAYSIDIGTRAAVIMVPYGLGTAWSGQEYNPSGRHIVGEGAIRFGVNLIAYVLGSTEYGRFLAQEFPEYGGGSGKGDLFRFAQVRYKGSWSLNPGLQNSIAGGLHENTGIGVDYAPYAVSLDDPGVSAFPLLFMTGHYDFEFSAEEQKGLGEYLNRGGTLVVSAAAGLKPFDIAFRRELKRLFPENELVAIPPSHAVFMAGWNPVQDVEYTPAVLRDEPELKTPQFYGLFINQRLAVIYTPYDLMSGLNRESNSYAKGVESRDALRLTLNLITYCLSH